MKLSSLIDEMMLDENLKGNIDSNTWRALCLIKKISEDNKLYFRNEHVPHE